MPVPRTTFWPIEPHTRVKHLILRRYLNAWLPMMARYHGRIVYVDGFAGPGRYTGGEDGSPIIALTALLDHPNFRTPKEHREIVFIFIEKDEDRARALGERVKDFATSRSIPAWVKYEVAQGEFAPTMSEVLDGMDREGARLAPTFSFVDPFGFSGAPMEVIARIASNPRCECLVTFMFEAINRFLAHPAPAIAIHFDALFGTNRWRAILAGRDPDQRRDAIVTLYRQQLVEEAGLRYVRTFEMIDPGNRTEYFLYFGTNSKDGLSKMKVAMWGADPEGGRVFSDRTVTDQMVLLQLTVDLLPLRHLLQDHFRAQGWVWIDDIMDFVLVETPYSEVIHLKRRTLAPMERADPPLIEVRRPSGKRQRAGDYPEGTKIKFR